MAITSAKAYTGLQAFVEPSSEGTTGTVTIGQGQTATALTDATRAIVLGIELDSTYNVSINLSTLIPTLTGAGVNQVETATAAGTITATGNATVIVTGDDITGSPLTVSVAVTNTDTASTWAGKVRTALNATTAITSIYTVSGATDQIILTRTLDRYHDSTLNISLANGTCTGITTAATSVNTTEGINPAKCWRISGTTFAGEDFEGVDLPTPLYFQGFQIRHTVGAGLVVIATDVGFSDKIAVNETTQKHSSTASSGLFSFYLGTTLTATSSAGYSKCILTLFFSP